MIAIFIVMQKKLHFPISLFNPQNHKKGPTQLGRPSCYQSIATKREQKIPQTHLHYKLALINIKLAIPLTTKLVSIIGILINWRICGVYHMALSQVQQWNKDFA